jgi:ribonuclease J
MIECPIYARPFAAEMIKDKLSQFNLDKVVPIINVSLQKKVEIGNFSVEFIQVAHSTPESSALAITTPEGVVLHSGDWRIDDDPVFGSKTDEKKLADYGKKGVLALACDSTNVFRDQEYGAEKDVRKNLIDLVEKYPKSRIFITCFASNLARLESCYMAAKESGRKLAIVGRSLKKIERIAKISGYFSEIPAFLDDKKASLSDPSKVLFVCTGSQGENNSALSKMANGTHKTIRLGENDIIIFSSRIIPGNEKDVIDVQNSIAASGAKIITSVDYEIHASGHPSRAELEHLNDLLKPHILIPIHGGKLHLCKHAEIAKEYGIKNILVPEDGSVIKLSKQNHGIIENFHTETLAIDGSRLIPLGSSVYKHRETLSHSGVVSICLKCSKGFVKLLDMNCLGVFEESDQVDITDVRNDLSSEIKLSMDNILKDKSSDKNRLKSLAEKLTKTIFLDATGKKPMVIVHVVD